MHRATVNRRPHAVGLLLLAALIAACGGSGPTPSTAAAPSAAATAPGSSGGQLLDVQIAQPYNLADLPAATADAIQTGIEKNLGAYGKAVHVAMKSVEQQGTSAAYLMVVAFPAGTLSDNIYQQVINDLSLGAEASFTSKLVGGVPVSFGPMSGGSVALFRRGDLVFIVLSPQTSDLTPVVGALVQVNG